MKCSFVKYVALSLFTAVACDSVDPGPGTSASKVKLVTDEEEAKMAFANIRSFWLNSVKPTIPKQTASVSKQVTGGAGKATLTGTVSHTRSSSSSSTYESTIMDVTSNFGAGFENASVKITGATRFYDSYSYEYRCSSSACASSTKSKISISATKLTVEFEYQGKKIKDEITISAYKEFTSWDVTVKSSTGATFDWYGG
jgi:hypothetical protein